MIIINNILIKLDPLTGRSILKTIIHLRPKESGDEFEIDNKFFIS